MPIQVSILFFLAILSSQAVPVLDNLCLDCHDAESAKGDVRLDNLDELALQDRLNLLNRVQEQVYFKHMPPKKKKQPSATERKAMLVAVAAELEPHNASTLEDKLERPDFANYVDHEALFSGEHADLAGFTYDRRWLISEFIFQDKFNRVLRGEGSSKFRGKRVSVFGTKRVHRQFTPTNPFLLPNRSGVRYYANVDLTAGHLSTMLTNAQEAAELVTSYLVPRYQRSKTNSYLPAIAEIMAMEDEHNATLAARREFLEAHIELVCAEIYGERNETLLPTFVPVVLEPLPELAEGEEYQKAPIHVASRNLNKLGADKLVFRALMDPQYQDLSEDEFREYCERIWFYRGDHERTIQGRMALLREYVPEFRKQAEKVMKKAKVVSYKPLADDEMATIRETILAHRKQDDRYLALIESCVAQWEAEFRQARIDAGPPSDELLGQLVDQLFLQVLERSPHEDEAAEHLALAKGYITKLGNLKAIQKLIQTVMLSSEFVYRQEFGAGEPDVYGRRMLSPRDASYAIAYALTDQSPDRELAEAAASGRLSTREDYRREVSRMLKRRDRFYIIDPLLADKNHADNCTNIPIRELRFFREFFGYPKALTIFKDEKRFGGDRLGTATARLLGETDLLVAHILERDQNVFEELLATDDFYVFHDGDNERMTAASDRIKRIYDYFKNHDWKNFDYEELGKHKDFLREVKIRSVNPDRLESGNRSGTGIELFKKSMTTITARLDKGQKGAAPFDMYRGYGSDFMPGDNVARFWNLPFDNWDYAPTQPAPIPNRKGLLTHPAWLIAHAQNTETDPVIRGKFIREKLLAGTIPDVPITVDAVIPEDHNATLRDRLASATETEYCWKCHELMNPLGYAFEAYDDFGRFRERESLEYPNKLIKKRPDEAPGRNHMLDLRDVYETLPVDSSGYLKGSGDPTLDGEINNAIDLSERLAKSARVRQSIIRHAFRYFMGRNETLSDSKTLIDADQAYLESGGSFDAVIVALLTSDSFIYRKSVASK